MSEFLAIFGYLVIGVVVAAVFAKAVGFTDRDELGFVGLVALIWPLFIVIAVPGWCASQIAHWWERR